MAAGDVTWSLADSPVELDEDFVLDGGVTLTIEAGVEVRLAAGVSVKAIGGSHIVLAGNEEDMVVVRPAGEADWGELSAAGDGGTMKIRHADISGGRVRFLEGVRGLIEDSRIHDSGAASIVNSSRATLVTMRRCWVWDYGETLFQHSRTILEECLFERPKGDAVDFDAAVPGSVIRQCTFRDGIGDNTDAIDIGPTGGVPSREVLIEGCVMHGFSDKGVSIGDAPNDAENIVVRDCLMYKVVRGVQVKHASSVTVHDCTIVDSQIGLHGFAKPGGAGGGIFTATYNNILTGNTSAIAVEDDTVIAVEFSNTLGASWPGKGNIEANSRFRDAANGDYRLRANSPCTGTGKFGDDMGVSFPVGGVPAAPRDLAVVSFDGGEAVLTWMDPDKREAEFRVEYSSDALNWEVAEEQPPPGTTSMVLAGLEGAPRWWFRIRGVNFIGPSFYSNLATTDATSGDLDGDGLPDEYEDVFEELDPGDPADAGLDPDSDGSTNWEEFVAGTDPSDFLSVLRIEEIAVESAGEVRIRFTAQAGRDYRVEFSDTLEPASWTTVAEIAAEPIVRRGLAVIDRVPPGTGQRIYRVVAMRSL